MGWDVSAVRARAARPPFLPAGEPPRYPGDGTTPTDGQVKDTAATETPMSQRRVCPVDVAHPPLQDVKIRVLG